MAMTETKKKKRDAELKLLYQQMTKAEKIYRTLKLRYKILKKEKI